MTLGSFLLGLAYYGLALLCLAVFKSKKKSSDTQRGLIAYLDALRSFFLALTRRFTQLPELARAAAPWLALALFLALFGLVRQLNLQVVLTEAIQSQAYVEGWYAERRGRQLELVSMLSLGTALVLLALLVLLRKRLHDVGLAIIGAVSLSILLAVRAISHHDVDLILMTPVAGVALAHLLELAGVALIAACALLSLRARQVKSAPQGPIVARIDSIDP